MSNPSSNSAARGRASRLDIGSLLDVDRLLSDLDHAVHDASRPGLVAVVALQPDHSGRLFTGEHGDFIGWAGGFERQLQSVDDRIRLAFRSADDAIGFVPGLGSRREVEPLVERIGAALDQPMVAGSAQVSVDSRAGVAVVGGDTPSGGAALEAASLALHRTSPGQRCVLFRPFERLLAERHRALEARILTDLRQGEVIVRYQPMVDLRTGRLAGVEALARLRDGRRGELPPGVFLPVAAAHGLMGAVSAGVLTCVIADIDRWASCDAAPFTVWINLSVQEVLDDTVMTVVDRLIHREAELRVGVELTETAATTRSQLARARAVLANHDLLAAVELETVPLSDIARNRFDTVKVGRRLIRQLEARSPAAFPALVDTLRELEVRVTAEGLETESHVRPAVAAGCDHGQGFYFARPCPAEAIDGLVHRPDPVGA